MSTWILEEHDIELLEGFEYNENISGTSIITLNDCEYVGEVRELEELKELEEQKELEEMIKIVLLNDLEGYEKHDEREMLENRVNSEDKI